MSRSQLLTIVITVVATACVLAATPKRDIKSIKNEQKAIASQVKETNRALTDNKRETERNLNRLNNLQHRMAESRNAIDASQTDIDSIDKVIDTYTDTLLSLTARLDAMRTSYARALKRQQLYPDVNSPLAFIFSASSVNEAYRRIRYLRQFDAWRSRKTAELTGAANEVAAARTSLQSARDERTLTLNQLKNQRDILEREQAATDSIVKVLRKQGSGLRAVLDEKQRRAEALDRELDRLIAEEQARAEAERKRKEAQRKEAERKRKEAERKEAERKRKEAESKKEQSETTKATTAAGNAAGTTTPPHSAPAKTTAPAQTTAPLDTEAEAERKLTGSFVANKGKLLFPVAGRYRIVRGYGLQNHPELKHVKTNNSGIDIEVAPGTDARAIFAGRVSAIFILPGYANIVMVRHGEYISLYANLASVYVTKGQDVKAGQPLGRILTGSEEEGGATTFHFELRKERNKLNPLEWVK
ncbi:MAG: peptidoglycan DD-metalloendopeptidase family protein [Bacteroides sp.]|nr:peptidoglycan DD-metalloendopeptidase family protein [Bacteroides sp.]